MNMSPDAKVRPAGVTVRFSIVDAAKRPTIPVRAGCDVDEIAGFDRFEPVPNTARNNVGVTGTQEESRFGADGALVTVVEDQLHRAAHDIEELVTVGVDLATVWPGPSTLGITPIVYPSIRCSGPGGAGLIVIDQSRATSATLPAKWTGGMFDALVMAYTLPATGMGCARRKRIPSRYGLAAWGSSLSKVIGS